MMPMPDRRVPVRMAAAWLLASLLISATPLRAENSVDLQLVLAVDASGSVDEREYRLQLSGIAAAFRDPEVIKAIGDGPTGRIAVSLLVWAESRQPKARTPWRIIGTTGEAHAFADLATGFGRPVGGGTGIGKAMFTAVRMLETSGLTSPRRVIDVSGDGRETTFREWSVPPDQARHAVIDRGITINGLAITAEDPDLARYYEREVTAGPGSFVMTARSVDDFARVMRAKLLREIQGELIVGAAPVRD
jgi:hypothetical protein